MLKLYPGNRMERLADQLAAVTAAPLADPFAAEIIVTQSIGMAHWLRLELAERHRIAANLRFLLPAALVWELIRSQNPLALPERSAFDRTALSWRVFQQLPGHLKEPSFAPLSAYLAGNDTELKRYQLSAGIADLFDQYLVFRPELIDGWDHGADAGDWQAELWRSLSVGSHEPHRVALLNRFLRQCSEGLPWVDRLPGRVSVFGLSTLPPAHLDVMDRLGESIDVHLFFLNPCREYWGDIRSERAWARQGRWRRSDIARSADATANPLLASMGQQGRDFFERLLDTRNVEPSETDELFEDPGQTTLLRGLQSDILHLRDPAQQATANVPGHHDDSVRIHVCHSPMREIEVLHDQLLALFDRHRDLELRDIVVMAPDIETYAPFVASVFSQSGSDTAPTTGGGTPRLPYSLADRSAKNEHPLLQAFLSLLQLPGSRLKASEVLGLLQTPAIRRRFGLDEEQFAKLQGWVWESGIRWGLDAEHRRELGLPAVPTHSWDFGLERLFLGYALTPSERLFEDVAPFEDVEGQAAETLGKLQSFIETLREARQSLLARARPAEWTRRLNRLFDNLFAIDDQEARLARCVRDALAAFDDEAMAAGFDSPVGLDVVESWLQRRLTEPTPSQRFCIGQITFCSLLPMRSIPFRIVCLIGMNDGDFPRRRKPIGFDKIAQDPRPGDRSRREDDRYLFLETLLSARDHLYISYVGRNIRDNSELLPAVVVSELLETIRHSDQPESAGVMAPEPLIVEHPMQPFSAHYFAPDSTLFSYAAEWLASSAGLVGARPGPAPFIHRPLDEPDGSFRQVHLEQLIRFFRNPARCLLENRLAVFLGEHDAPPEDHEPFALDALENYAIRQRLLDRHETDGDASTVRLFAAEGYLPEAPFDRLALEPSRADVDGLLQRLAANYGDHLNHPRKPLAFELDLGDFHLYGVLKDLYAPGLLMRRAAKLKASDRLNLWIRHLLLQTLSPDSARSVFAALDQDMTLDRVTPNQASGRLQQLLDLYWQGLQQALPFFPETSYAYAGTIARTGDTAAAENAAIKAWQGNERVPGEGQDSVFRVAFRGQHGILGQGFADLAISVLQPMIEAGGP